MRRGSLRGRFKILKCVKARQCGGRCLSPGDVCRIDDAPTRALASKLIAKVPQYKKSRKGPKISYITQSEARLMRLVISSPNSLKDMASGAAPHPLIRINKTVTDKQIQKTLDRIKDTKNTVLLKRIKTAGIRKQGNVSAPNKDEQARLFIGAYLRQGGRDFYTGKKLNLATAVIDHLVPLSRGGTNEGSNLALTTRNLNFYKKAFDQSQLQVMLKTKTEGLDPQFGDRLRKVLASGNIKEGQALAKSASAELKKLERESDRRQAQALRAARSEKANLATQFKDGGWMLFNTAGAIQALSPKALKELLREQGESAGGAYSWYRSPTTSGGQVSETKGDSGRAVALIQSGAKRADVPTPWLNALKVDIQANRSETGQTKLRNSLGPEFRDLFE